MRLIPSRRDYHTKIRTHEKENEIDPDDGNSWLCSACTLPIFSTPFEIAAATSDGGGKLFLHDECASLPEELSHPLHRGGRLILKANTIPNINSSSSWCHNCNRTCGSTMYQCPDGDCRFQLDVLCALQIKILHRSHEHRLTVMRGGPASFTCGACGTEHEDRSTLFYLCNVCEFWIHPDCASLPNVITVLHHRHSLFLTFGLGRRNNNACAICRGVIRSLGVYFCVECNYFAHIQCAISNPDQSFKPVLIRDAKLAGVLHFPMPDEYTSMMQYITENTASSSVLEEEQVEGKLVREKLHQHPLFLHDQTDGGDESTTPRVCNACVQLISSPFYSCSECPDFVLHSGCANLPSQIRRPVHQHPLSLFPKSPKSSTVSGFFYCSGCSDSSNRFSYSCSTCDLDMDVVCALLPPAITHELHGNTHVLYMSINVLSYGSLKCKCCDSTWNKIFYKCTSCHDFAIDAKCAMFPSSTKHRYDEHRLKLITMDDEDGGDLQFCEICEKKIRQKRSWKWCYNCSQCEQWFHCYCIPSVNRCSRIKLGGTIHVDCHDCPLALVLDSTVSGYRCGYCSKPFCSAGLPVKPAYECSKCYFRMHDECATKCLLKC